MPDELAHDRADRNIADYQQAINEARAGSGTADIQICKDQIDRWLDYRNQHTPDERTADL